MCACGDSQILQTLVWLSYLANIKEGEGRGERGEGRGESGEGRGGEKNKAERERYIRNSPARYSSLAAWVVQQPARCPNKGGLMT